MTPAGSISSGIILVVLLFCPAGARTAHAQLISPGKLTDVHRELEGLRNCTACHTLGSKGVDNSRCLDCHEPLRDRVDAGRGYHAGLADPYCGACHKEHFGADFDLVRLDTTRFNHAETGYRLTGAHAQTTCRRCHQPALIADEVVRSTKARHGALDRTFLGLSSRCLTCHEPDSPHGTQFATPDCSSCHATERWEEAPRFDHDGARFKLTGLHREVACNGCHPSTQGPGDVPRVQYTGLAYSGCASCHTDAHAGTFGTNCRQCHSEVGWHRLERGVEGRFDHASTGFTLVGRHARLACAACHTVPARRDESIRLSFVRGSEHHTYPQIRATDCLSCHVAYHGETFAQTPGGILCENCHTQEAWVPITYDLERHNREARFQLTGAHLATPCTACHEAGDAQDRFHFDDLTCRACHSTQNPHGDQFADADGRTACEDCHEPDTWTGLGIFEHDATRYPLTGRHLDVACNACHRPAEGSDTIAGAAYRGLSTTCKSCHAEVDPHQEQFAGQACDTCHDTSGFASASEDFDHGRTRFPLDGAHRKLACTPCHRQETTPGGATFVRYRPLRMACKDCHSDG